MIRTQMPGSRGGKLFVWLVFATFIGVGFGWFGGGKQLPEAARLRASGLHAPGGVTSIMAGDALNNPTAYYDFEVGTMKVHGHAHIQAKDEHHLAPGSAVTVTYLVQNPNDNCVDPDGLAESGWRAVLIACVLELVLAAIFIPLIVWGGQMTPVAIQLKGENLAGVVVISILALVGMYGLFLAAIPNYERSEELVSQGKSVQAAITGVYDHSQGGGRYADYTFVVNGSYYHGKDDYAGGYGDRGPLTITYLASDPSFSAIRPQNKLVGARWAVLFMIGWLALLALISLGFFFGARRVSSWKG